MQRFGNDFDKAMRRQNRIFCVVFAIVVVVIVCVWLFVFAAIHQTFTCIGSDKCIEDTGKSVGSFVKGVTEGSK